MFYVIINKYAPMSFSWNGTTTVSGQEAKFQTMEAAQKAVDWYREFPGNENSIMEIVRR
ncbi:hypothetical protein [Acidithiobacillus ferrooxidans]|uniref:hypothetical protein n=1 Tax=Acidithiobacillus ferrooxidans TaxID=920 RepID=UPI000AA216C1|nr:hypothetical protein [Acidithiobacillus ferrooxidans]